MAKIKKIYRSDFTVLSTAMFRDRNLNLKDRGLLATMLSLPEDWDFSIKGLASIVDDGEKTIRNSLQRLEELKYLVRRRLYRNGKVYDWEYIFSDHPLTDADLSGNKESKSLDVRNGQLASSLDVQKVHVEKVHVQNDIQLNIQEENIQEENTIYDISGTDDAFDSFLSEVCRTFGVSKSRLTKKQRGLIKSWYEQKTDISLIKRAHDEAWGTFDKSKMNFSYVSGILKNWAADGKTEEDFPASVKKEPEDDIMLKNMFTVPEYDDDGKQ